MKRNKFNDEEEIPKESEEEEEGIVPWGSDWSEIDSVIGNTDKAKGLFSRLWKSMFENENEAESNENDFFSRFIGLARPWWKGENVCTREINSANEEESDEANENSLNALTTSCADLGSVYKCTMKMSRNGRTKIRTIIYECCQGYERDTKQMEKGCSEAVELSDVQSTLERENLTQFVSAIKSFGRPELLNSERNYTYFVPTTSQNSIMGAITDSKEESFVFLNTDDDNKFLRNILLGHIVEGLHHSYDFTDEETIESIEVEDGKKTLIRLNYYNYPRPFVTANCVLITSSDIRAHNALIHRIDRQMMPVTQTLWELVQDDPELSTFASLLNEYLHEKLEDENTHWTVLAFTNDAFELLEEEIRSKIRGKHQCFQELANEHILPHTICSSAVYGTNAVVNNIAGHYLNASRNLGDKFVVTFEGGNVIGADRMATNGVLQIIDKVLLPKHMLNTMKVLKLENAATFSDALMANNLNVDDFPEVTVFVPPKESLQLLHGDPKSTLEDHIFGEKVSISSDLIAEHRSIESIGGRSMSVSVSRPISALDIFFSRQSPFDAYIGCSRIVNSNLNTCNGIIHFIDKPISIFHQSLLELLRSRSDLSDFMELIESSDVLDEESEYTLLVPINEGSRAAFTQQEKDQLMTDEEKLKQFIKKHVIKGSQCSHRFSSPFGIRRLLTESGQSILSRGQGSTLLINGISVLESDLIASNGIVHILQRPIVGNSRSANQGLWDFFKSIADKQV